VAALEKGSPGGLPERLGPNGGFAEPPFWEVSNGGFRQNRRFEGEGTEAQTFRPIAA
jgi:hypothetical protein